MDSYRHWANHFERDDLTPGLLGENLTVEGLPDDEVCIGDRYRIGDLVLEVTQPRVTCYRAGMRIGVPQMAALLVSHRRPGFYCRVITEGSVAAGQEVVKVSSGPEQVTVAEIDALLYLPGHPRDALQRALRIPALSVGWQTSLRALADQPASGSTGNVGLTGVASSPPAWTGFRSLRVTALRDETPYVRSVSFVDPDGPALPKWQPGQSITVRLPFGESSLIRNYSLSNRPGSTDYRISVKREPHGQASGYVHTRLQIDDLVDVAAPRGTFFLTDAIEPVILLSAGIGATPVLSMLHELAAAGSTREVWWLHAARDSSELPFGDEVTLLAKQLPHGHFHTFYSDSAQGHHRLSIGWVEQLGVPHGGDAYVCGPATFMADLNAGLIEHGFDPARVHTELFGAGPALTPGIAESAVPPHLPTGPPGPGPDIQFARSGIHAPWGPPSASLLEFAESCDVPTRWSCRTGVCHNCETALLAGTVHYDPEPLEPPAEGNVLICCSQPTAGVVLDL